MKSSLFLPLLALTPTVNAEDRNGTDKPGGYTHFEEYLHSID